jgi:hypothetical protein
VSLANNTLLALLWIIIHIATFMVVKVKTSTIISFAKVVIKIIKVHWNGLKFRPKLKINLQEKNRKNQITKK